MGQCLIVYMSVLCARVFVCLYAHMCASVFTCLCVCESRYVRKFVLCARMFVCFTVCVHMCLYVFVFAGQCSVYVCIVCEGVCVQSGRPDGGFLLFSICMLTNIRNTVELGDQLCSHLLLKHQLVLVAPSVARGFQ